MQELFISADHPSIAVSASIEDVLSAPNMFLDKSVIIIVSSSLPDRFGNNNSVHPDQIIFNDNNSYEIRTIVNPRLKNRDSDSKPNQFEAKRWMRHEGDKYNNWLCQEQNHKIVTQCSENIVTELMGGSKDETNYYFSPWVMVCVQNQSTGDDQCRLNFFKSIGGKAHV